MEEIIKTNAFQTPITKELLNQYPEEVRDDKCYIVYRHISPCGGTYVGITKMSLYDRWGKDGCRYKRCKLFYRAIQKYGWDSFIHEVILDKVSKSEAIYAEKYLVRWYKMHKMSYNITDGGESTAGIHMPEDAKQKISKYLKENRGRAVLQYSMNGDFIKEYKSATIAAEELGYGKVSVSNCASGRKGNNVLHGHIFVYKDEVDSLPHILELCKEHWRKYKIVQYQNGIPINIFESLHGAERATGISRVCIKQNIRGKFKMAGGYTWRKIMCG